MNITYVLELLKAMYREYNNYAPWCWLVFVLIATAVIILGYRWPQIYESSTDIMAVESSVGDLMRGHVVGIEINERNAKEDLFSRSIIRSVIEAGGWTGPDGEPLTPIQLQLLGQSVRRNTKVKKVGAGILRISYQDADAQRAFLVASKYAEMFVAETTERQKSESQAAYDFIDKQVAAYHKKLQEAETNLKQYRARNLGVNAGGENEVFGHLSNLQQRLEQTELALKEALIRKHSLEGQLSGEISQSRVAMRTLSLQQKAQELQAKLDTMRLTYHDTYPDIVQIKQQIAEIKASIRRGGSSDDRYLVPSSDSKEDQYSPLYQQLRGDLAAVNTEIDLHRVRIDEVNKLIQQVRGKMVSINESAVIEAEMVRDYEVNQGIYQSLLQKRENARLSMDVDKEGKGVTYKVRQPANLPLLPTGMRFLYFLVIGPILGVLVPIGCLFALVQFDGRIRNLSIISKVLSPPIMMSMTLSDEQMAFRYKPVMVGLGAVLLIYGVMIALRLSGFDVAGSALDIIGGAR